MIIFCKTFVVFRCLKFAIDQNPALKIIWHWVITDTENEDDHGVNVVEKESKPEYEMIRLVEGSHPFRTGRPLVSSQPS
jgi:hypothetical protein